MLPSNMRWTTIVSILISGSCIAQWTQLPDLPGTARDDAASFAIDGRIYVGTGREVGFGYTNDWFAFDEASGTWSVIASLPASGRQYCTTFSDGVHGYLFGGTNGGGPLNELWRYDPALDLWEQRAPLPGPGRYACASMPEGHIVGGLLANGITTNEHWSYDLVLDEWSPRAALPGTGRHRAAAGEGWVMGGADETYTALSDGYAFDGGDPGVWSPMEDLPNALYGADATGEVIIGGASSDTVLYNDVWYYYLSGWFTLYAFPGGGRRGGAIASSNGPGGQSWIYYGTGTDLFQRHNDWWRLSFDPANINEHDRMLTTVFPNPASYELRVETGADPLTKQYMISDALGRTVRPKTPLANGSIDVSQLAIGHYQLLIDGGIQLTRTNFMIIR